jgi:hypothetical protein
MVAYPTLNFNHNDDINMLRDMIIKFSQSEISPREASTNHFQVIYGKNLVI